MKKGLSILVIAVILLGGTVYAVAEESSSTAPVKAETTTVTGTIMKATQMEQGYYLMLEKLGTDPGIQSKEVLTVSPESEIILGGVKKSPDELLRDVQVGKDEATATYFRNAEGMKQVISIKIVQKR